MAGLLIVLAIGMYIYRSQLTGPGDITQGTGNPRAAIDITGVKNDLLRMAQAERSYWASNAHYTSLEELQSIGDLVIDPTRGRAGYSYTAEFSDQTFTITATYAGPTSGMPTISIDQTMQTVEF
ncbi:MAG: hypothetical protein EXQ56_08130 [Acidobacteria bacterium]|nr:hypothetical protein [Acidobacteriota bacterium]